MREVREGWRLLGLVRKERNGGFRKRRWDNCGRNVGSLLCGFSWILDDLET